MAAMINEVADKLFLKYLLTDSQNPLEQVGVYGANYKLAVLMTLFIQMFKYAAEPFFFKQAKEKNAKESYATIMKYFVIFGISIFLGVNLFLDVIKHFIGSEFHEGLKIVPIVLMANLFLGIYYNLSVWYKLTNKTQLGALVSIVGAIITLSINFLFIPIYGYMASAWATFVAYGTMMLLSWLWGQKHYPVQYPISRIVFYFAISLLIFSAYQYIKFDSIIIENIFSTVLLGSFIAIAFILERGELKQNLKK
jgi:O-antigen/teichoic acid export membrane protein